MAKLSIGVIGIGFGQHVHVPAFWSDPRCEVTAICATTLDRAQAAASALGIPKAYGDPQALIADPTIDAVSIAVPPYLQPGLIELAARAGKHVYCEKPLGHSLEESIAAVNAVRQANVRHAMNFIFPEIPAWQAAKEIVDSHRLGRIRQAVVSWRVETRAYQARTDNWKTSRLQGGGTLLNLASHSVNYIEWLFGKIDSLAARLRGAPVDAGVESWMQIGNLNVVMSVSGDSYLGTGHRIDVYFEGGTLVLRNESSDYVNGFELLVGDRVSEKLIPHVSPRPSTIDGRITATACIISRFIDSIANQTPMTPNLIDGLRVQKLLDAMRKASETGQWVSVEPMTPQLDIIIPVYNEGEGILSVLNALVREMKTPFRVLICYDHDDDTTLKALAEHPIADLQIEPVKNEGIGALGAVLTGFRRSTAPAAMVIPADDDYNAARIDMMVEQFKDGCEIVCGSRFMRGGCMIGCRWLKATLVRASAIALYHAARLPTRDPSNGMRLFSRRVLDQIPIESTVGFAYSLELLVKSHRLGWKIGESPLHWYERKQGQSRFRILKWLPQYLRWFGYAFATTYLRRGPETVNLVTRASRP